MDDSWIRPPPQQRLTDEEQFTGLDATVRDFWAYAMRDLRSNTTRGLLAEWLVLRAVGATELQPEWAEFDVLTPDRTRVEVKSSAYLQSWNQRRLSRITFSGLRARTWTPEVGDAPGQTYNADVYVFCLQTAQTHEEFNPLDLNQWEFYVVPRVTIEATGYASIGLPALRLLAQGPVGLDDLCGAIREAR